MSGYRLTPQARAGLQRLLEHISAHFGVTVAEQVLSRIESALASLSEYPGSGHCRGSITSDPRVRFRRVGPTLIAYREAEGVIEVLFVERGERDWDRLFEEE